MSEMQMMEGMVKRVGSLQVGRGEVFARAFGWDLWVARVGREQGALFVQRWRDTGEVRVGAVMWVLSRTVKGFRKAA